MIKDKKQFILDEDIVKEVQSALQTFIDHIDENCTRSGCFCDLRGEPCSQRIRDILHDFNSGLHLVSPSPLEEGTKKK